MKKWLRHVCLLCITVLLVGSSVLADERADSITLMKTTEATRIYETPDENGKTVMTLKTDAVVAVIGQENGVWSQVNYQGKSGYVETSKLTEYIEQEVLDKEFEAVYEDDMLWFSEITEALKQERQAKIWGTCIVLLVVAIFGIGILSAVKKNQEEQQK